jgi:hypothetical protein
MYFLACPGLTLNGRKYKQGDHCEYLPYVRPRRGEQGAEGSSLSHKVGTVRMVYRIKMEGPGPEWALFVSLLDRPELGYVHNMYEVATVREDTRLVGFNHNYSLHNHTLVHVDSITSKIKLVPHFNQTKRATHMCGIRIWLAR